MALYPGNAEGCDQIRFSCGRVIVEHCLFNAPEGIADVEVLQVLDRVLIKVVAMAGQCPVEDLVWSGWGYVRPKCVDEAPDASVVSSLCFDVHHGADVMDANGRTGHVYPK